MSTATEEVGAGAAATEPLVHILWMNGGLGCDGDSVALTAATQPSIEEIVLGALPGLPQIAVNWPRSSWSWRARSPTRRSSPRGTGAGSATTRPPGSR